MIAQFQLTSVLKRYGTRVALELDELTLWPGRVYVLAGANGSGKSTLLNILAFLARPEHGEVMFAGKRVTWKEAELNALRRKVTLLHQSSYLFTGSVFANLAFGLKLRGLRGEELRDRVTDALSLVGLAGFQQRNVTQLSGGESRRVALARALALQPEILLFDEPMANLDRHSSEIVDRVIASLPAGGTTVVMATHDPQHGERLDAEVIRLVDGRLDDMPRRNSGETRWDEVQICQPLTMPAV